MYIAAAGSAVKLFWPSLIYDLTDKATDLTHNCIIGWASFVACMTNQRTDSLILSYAAAAVFDILIAHGQP